MAWTIDQVIYTLPMYVLHSIKKKKCKEKKKKRKILNVLWHEHHLQFGGIERYISWDFFETSCRAIDCRAFAVTCSWAFRIHTTRYITCSIIVVTCKTIMLISSITSNIQLIRFIVFLSPSPHLSPPPSPHSIFLILCQQN